MFKVDAASVALAEMITAIEAGLAAGQLVAR